MAGAYKTPGVYIVEKNAFPNSVVEVATAVPAFVGYTEKADNKGTSLKDKPWRITSLAEYHNYFGAAPQFQLDIKKNTDGKADLTIGADGYDFAAPVEAPVLRFYHCLVHFFQNGGGACYIVSVGAYLDAANKPVTLKKDEITTGIQALLKEQEPTLLVIPDAVALPKDECKDVQTAMLEHCGTMRNRFAILDVYEGQNDLKGGEDSCVGQFRNDIGSKYLNFGAAYYPWVNTSVVSASSITYANVSDGVTLKLLLHGENLAQPTAPQAVQDKITEIGKKIDEIPDVPVAPVTDQDKAKVVDLHKVLSTVSPLYGRILQKVQEKVNLLPPSAAMAGIYTMVDNTRGVWKAPANMCLNAVSSPAVNITHDEQEDLNVPLNGKAINAIRAFLGEGTLVWGARTLDGNSLDWRYINVRRTMIMLEESIRIAIKAYVFDPNAAGTWINLKSMIQNFLTGIWKRGGLAGSTPADAFDVLVGLGETMTAQDILDGILKVTVLVALVRPAEFIEITFQQQMQKS
ncbi:MAG: hypothetical protein RL318_939 [Fibrobacterota bacterium]|jgi:phage tail sheath protein FI